MQWMSKKPRTKNAAGSNVDDTCLAYLTHRTTGTSPAGCYRLRCMSFLQERIYEGSNNLLSVIPETPGIQKVFCHSDLEARVFVVKRQSLLPCHSGLGPESSTIISIPYDNILRYTTRILKQAQNDSIEQYDDFCL